jgi:hypothetical protein
LDKAERDAASYADGTADANLDNLSFANDGRYGVYARVLHASGEYSDYKTFVEVENVAPTDLEIEVDSAVQGIGETTTLSGAFVDPGVEDNYIVTIDWGDGTPATVLPLDGSVQSFSATHQYEPGGTFIASARLREVDHYNPISETIERFATGVGVNDGALYVIGSEQDDEAEIRLDENHLVVTGSMVADDDSSLDADSQRIPLSEVTSIFAWFFDGSDHLRVRSSVDLPIEAHGGGDSDFLYGGSGPVRFFGDAGSDVLKGGFQDDHLHGGPDADLLFGEAGNDFLDGGTEVDELFGGPGGDQFVHSEIGDYYWGGDAGQGLPDQIVVQTVGHSFEVDESLLSHFDSIEEINLRSAENVLLEADPNAIREHRDAEHVLLAHVMNYQSLSLEPQWTLRGGEMRDGIYRRSYQVDNADFDVAGPIEWQNPVMKLDVDGNDQITAGDALLIINELLVARFTDLDGRLLIEGFTHEHPGVDWNEFRFFDTSGNGYVTAIDALRVINQLYRQSENSSQAAEGENITWTPMREPNSLDLRRRFDKAEILGHESTYEREKDELYSFDWTFATDRDMALSGPFDAGRSHLRLRESQNPTEQRRQQSAIVDNSLETDHLAESLADQSWQEKVDDLWSSNAITDED